MNKETKEQTPETRCEKCGNIISEETKTRLSGGGYLTHVCTGDAYKYDFANYPKVPAREQGATHNALYEALTNPNPGPHSNPEQMQAVLDMYEALKDIETIFTKRRNTLTIPKGGI